MILCDGNYGLGAYGMYLVHSRPREPERSRVTYLVSYVNSGSVLFQKQRVLCAEHAQTKSAPKPLQNTLHQ